MVAAGWLDAGTRQPQYVVAQASGCAPIAKAVFILLDSSLPAILPPVNRAVENNSVPRAIRHRP